ncbi:MAG: hypothetical protein WBX25_31730, partial [Rhodomicrobium sp.]
RAVDRDAIRGRHYGQRPCVSRNEGRTHGCPDQSCDMRESLDSLEPSTHGPERLFSRLQQFLPLPGEEQPH